MKTRLPLAALALALALGCEREPTSDEIIPVDQVPPMILDVAKKELPGFKFDTVYKTKVDGKDVYEVRGKDSRGKTREVEVSAEGKVLAIE